MLNGTFKKLFAWLFIASLWLIAYGSCEELTSVECQTEYNLIPINAIDDNYCTTNWYCNTFLSGKTETWINWSSIYINEIQHEWAENIIITIPTTTERTYNYTWDTLELTINWQWYDEEKMLWIINMQNYKPTWEEMSNLVWKIADFLPLLWVAILFMFIWYCIKKIFRF